ncbi:F0F1 ATP synthase subunit I [Parashewanella curva]|uniref:F0F1 ATP synthase subunit I n=1 Tax=Parashewanella curva TaxID=2338552 RepID=A0A3L8Q091_9GAMM|nr:ATP synthase subunit I [Parashewanella curva]RLV60840.1 F0F1 ATP synthase subunit I [Parashewanella curva]
MTAILARRGRSAAYKLVLAQAVVSVVSFIIFSIVWELQYGIAAFAGGLVAVVPNFVFATLAFSRSGASQADKVLKSFYWGEAVKLLLTIALFSLIFSVFKFGFMPVFVGYLLALMVHWTAPLYFKQS